MRHINNVVEYGGFIFTPQQYKDLKRLEKKEMYYDSNLFANIFGNDLSEDSQKEIDEIVKQVNNDEYVLDHLIIGSEYPTGSLQIGVNPLTYEQQGAIVLNNEHIKTIAALSNLLKARDDKKDAEASHSSKLYSAWNSYKKAVDNNEE